MSKIVWLASYPKSGNTWVRVFIANLLSQPDRFVDINELRIFNAGTRHFFDEALGLETSNLTNIEINCLRPKVYAYWAANSIKSLFLKIHNAFPYTPDGQPAITSQFTHGALYIIRNPLAVAPSATTHFGSSLEKVVKAMSNENFGLFAPPEKITTQLDQPLKSWSSHVRSWVDQTFIPVHVIRYEDMLFKPTETFSAAARFAGLSEDPQDIDRAIQFSSFNALRQQEQERGFREKSPVASAFFRRGKAGTWREELTPEQASRIIADHGEVMRRFGYLDENGEPTF